jgi:hypothetical protein
MPSGHPSGTTSRGLSRGRRIQPAISSLLEQVVGDGEGDGSPSATRSSATSKTSSRPFSSQDQGRLRRGGDVVLAVADIGDVPKTALTEVGPPHSGVGIYEATPRLQEHFIQFAKEVFPHSTPEADRWQESDAVRSGLV